MNKLYQHRYVIRQNMITLIGISLCFYFSYHSLYGNRSAMKLFTLNQETATMSLELTSLQEERQTLEKKVIMMRPGTLDRDLLEERARLVLGYKHPGEFSLLQN